MLGDFCIMSKCEECGECLPCVEQVCGICGGKMEAKVMRQEIEYRGERSFFSRSNREGRRIFYDRDGNQYRNKRWEDWSCD